MSLNWEAFRPRTVFRVFFINGILDLHTEHTHVSIMILRLVHAIVCSMNRISRDTVSMKARIVGVPLCGEATCLGKVFRVYLITNGY